MEGKKVTLKYLKVSPTDCKKAVPTKNSPFGVLHKIFNNRWQTTKRDYYKCKWLQLNTEWFDHFKIKSYNAQLTGDDPWVHQSLAVTTCNYEKSGVSQRRCLFRLFPGRPHYMINLFLSHWVDIKFTRGGLP